ncbi:ribokinase [Oscillochloris sp. ZM17-4]|uniref:PfkB family carbohydrate kinase n=1 Tax=Oscillochloris sp. ZM17-4 TaxID=2866714 RepID=UPI001C729D4B|nr:PfkB family carbohydrate kinase [Oscillochloris sp. ZM17-4]MBX0330442.1 ribokinase [Oscillochloris sp. ZM17-4]
MASILAFGNPVYDEIITPSISTPGRVLSGCSTNACLALSRLGRQTMLVGRVGPDFRDVFAADMARFGVSARTHPDTQTGGFRLVYDRRGDRTLDVLGVAGPITQLPPIAADTAAIIVGPILQETPLSLIEDIRRQSSAPIFLDPQGMLRRIGADGRIEHDTPADFPDVARHCRLIKANELETRVLTGIEPREDVAAAASALRSLGCEMAIVTLAEAGSFIDDGRRQIAIPAYPTDARDPTGAGDTYMAGFIHAYLTDPEDLYRAGCTGAAVASIWIEHTGPEAPITLAEVSQRLDTLLFQRQS